MNASTKGPCNDFTVKLRRKIRTESTNGKQEGSHEINRFIFCKMQFAAVIHIKREKLL